MKCKKCFSTDVKVQVVSDVSTKGKGCLYWIVIGWWLQPLLWLFLTLPMIIITIFKGKKIKTKHKTMCVCQCCGYTWNK